MKMPMLILCAITFALMSYANSYRLKYSATVDIVEDGKVIGSKSIKAGSFISLAGIEPCEKTDSVEKSAPSDSKSRMSLKFFQSTRPKSGAWFRCEVALDDYYNYDFEGKKETHISVSIFAYNPDGMDYDSVAGYVQRNNPTGKRLMQLIKDGNRHLVYAKLVPVSNKTDCAVILEAFKPIIDH